MFPVILVTFVSALSWVDFVQSYQICNNPSPSTYFNEYDCAATTWFVYGGSIDCPDCCITRNMTVPETGKVLVTDITTTNGVTSFATYLLTRYVEDPIYRIENKSFPLVILDTDCTNYAVLYNYNSGVVQTFISKAEQKDINFQNELEGVKKCGIQMFDYNPIKNCK